MTSRRLEGRRVLVVGASTGIGRASALALAATGARVAVAARRRQLLDGFGPGSVGIACDVSDPDSCEFVVRTTVDAFGGLDALVYTPGTTVLTPIADADAAAWRETFETNLFGASLVTRAALPHLLQSRGKVVYISSIAIDDRPPRPGLALYIASKVALESMARAWQGEHPTVGFTTIAVGDTLTEKASVAPPEIVAELVPRWVAAGLMPGRLMQPESVAEQVVNVLASQENVRRLALTPIPPHDPKAFDIPGLHKETG